MPERRPPRLEHYTGIFFDEIHPGSAWMRDTAVLRLPPLRQSVELVLRGEFITLSNAGALPRAEVLLGRRRVARLAPTSPGPFAIALTASAAQAAHGLHLTLKLRGVALTNAAAWLGRLFAGWPGAGRLQRFRAQTKNRQLRVLRLETAAGELIYDFANRTAPISAAFKRRYLHLGLNIAGFFRADLGVAESARCMVRAADAANLNVALIELRLPCKNPATDDTYTPRLATAAPESVNVIHLDAPVSRDVDHYHPGLRAGRYNIGYWAWELPDFPDVWVPHARYFDEIWAPSRFAADAIAAKVPVPVLPMPHAIGFTRPTAAPPELRAKFALPRDGFLFLFLCDLNSYAERKNPRAVLEAFRRSGLAGTGAALVIKVHNVTGNEADLAALEAAARDLPGTTLLARTLPRHEIYELEAACDAFVSLHRAEGFGLALAECMFLERPVIATNWSATTEFLNAANGCPVDYRLVPVARSHGPYTQGQAWADPDLDHAADWMRRLAGDRALAQRLGAAARATMEEHFSPAVIGERYRRRLEAIATW
ncbi:glycosyltransferase [Horticoccus luteus]|uniref:Glycosyltransferase n=1 Tax=Horticoccus luteus TaxID=2862869 RepID=A0A8F9XIG1_9BACT|nr:glycosyltransferase [Horticoccus luteus]QYM77558.1 glycosyltransferase [Horticoccus luteus]